MPRPHTPHGTSPSTPRSEMDRPLRASPTRMQTATGEHTIHLPLATPMPPAAIRCGVRARRGRIPSQLQDHHRRLSALQPHPRRSRHRRQGSRQTVRHRRLDPSCVRNSLDDTLHSMRVRMGLSLHQPARVWANSRRRDRPAPGRSHPRERGSSSPVDHTATPSHGNRLRDHAPCRYRHLRHAARLMRPPPAARRLGRPISFQISLNPQQRPSVSSPPGGTGTTLALRTNATSTVGGAHARQQPRQRRLIAPNAVCLLSAGYTARSPGSSTAGST